MDRNQRITSKVQIFLHVKMCSSHTRVIYQQNTPGKFAKWWTANSINCSRARKHKNSHTCTQLHAGNNCFLCNCVLFYALFNLFYSLFVVFFFLVKWGPCVYLIDAVPLLGVSNRSCWFINKKTLVWHLKMPAEPFSSSLNFCMQSVHSQDLSAAAAGCSPCCAQWARHCWPRRGAEASFLQRGDVKINDWASDWGVLIRAKKNSLCLSPALT